MDVSTKQSHVEKKKTAEFVPVDLFATFLEMFKSEKSDKQEAGRAEAIVSALLFEIGLLL